MSTKELYDLLKVVEELEAKAAALYTKYIEEIRDEEIVKEIRYIRDDEVRHARLTSEAASLVMQDPEYSKLKDYLGDFTDTTTCHINTDLEGYMRTNIAVLNHFIDERGFRCIYLAMNRPSASLAKYYEKEGIDLGSISFIDCSSVDTGQPGTIYADHENLTDIITAIRSHSEQVPGEKFVYFDTFSSLYIFHPGNMVEKFVHGFIPRLKNIPLGLAMVTIDFELDQKARTILESLSDVMIDWS